MSQYYPLYLPPAGGRDAGPVRALPQAGVRDVRHPVLRAREAARALPGSQGPPAEEARHTRQGVGKGKLAIVIGDWGSSSDVIR